jgi:hypothetical protein
MSTCVGCHRLHEGDGVYSILTMSSGRRDQFGLRVTDAEEQRRATTDWLRRTYTWGLLQGMWEATGR